MKRGRPHRRRVVVTGWGMVTPLGREAEETFRNAAAGKSGIDHLSSFDPTGLPCTIGGQVDDRWLDAFETGRDCRVHKISSRALRLMRMASQEALSRAGLDDSKDRDPMGVVLGSHGDNPTIDRMTFLQRFYDPERGWDLRRLDDAGGYPFLDFFRRKPDVGVSILAALFNCKGATLSISSACAAGSQAIGEAAQLIRDDCCDLMLAGGAEATLDFMGLTGFCLLRALVEKYTTPQTASRPFDRKRNGFVMSEGAGAVVLEELEHARSRGANILGEILGYGSAADAYRITDTHPKGLGALYAMRNALLDAGLSPADVNYINAHGTSTQQNDLTETHAIRELLGDASSRIPVSSNKSMLGHTIAAAGAIECILTLMGMERSILLPTINYEVPDPKCDLDYVPNQARHAEHRIALSNSFGFGGQNACLCLGAFQE